MKKIETVDAPAAIGPYSQGISTDSLVFTSGQLGLDPATGAFAEGGVEGQTRRPIYWSSHDRKDICYSPAAFGLIDDDLVVDVCSYVVPFLVEPHHGVS